MLRPFVKDPHKALTVYRAAPTFAQLFRAHFAEQMAVNVTNQMLFDGKVGTSPSTTVGAMVADICTATAGAMTSPQAAQPHTDEQAMDLLRICGLPLGGTPGEEDPHAVVNRAIQSCMSQGKMASRTAGNVQRNAVRAKFIDPEDFGGRQREVYEAQKGLPQSRPVSDTARWATYAATRSLGKSSAAGVAAHAARNA